MELVLHLWAEKAGWLVHRSIFSATDLHVMSGPSPWLLLGVPKDQQEELLYTRRPQQKKPGK